MKTKSICFSMSHEEMKKYLLNLLKSIDGLLGIVITDRDGVPLLKVASEDAPELGMRPSFLSTFGMATDQASKLGMGKNTKIVCVYGTYQIIHFNCAPLVITAIGLSGANTGQIMQLDTDLQPLVKHLTPVVDLQ